MKKIKLITLSSVIASLALCAITALNNKKVESAEASSLKTSTGTFVRVDNYGEIDVGMNVVFVSEDGYALDDVWGNPAFVHGTRQGVTVANNGRLVALNNSTATIFHVEKGTVTRTVEGVSQDSFAFRADEMSISGEKKTNVYFAHNEEEDYSGRHDYDYVGWFKDRDIAVQQRLIKESSWYLDFETVEEWDELVRVTHIRNAKNYEGNPNTELTFTHNYSDRFVSDAGGRVFIYRQFSESEYNIQVMENPTKSAYYAGENINLTGLEIILSSPAHDHVEISYNDNPSDFSFPETAYGSGNVELECYCQGFKFVVPITVTNPQYSAYKTGEMADYRGKYMIVAFDGNVALDSTDISSNLKVTYDNERYRFYTGSESFYEDLQFEVTKDNSGYHIRNSSNYYLDLDSLSLTNSSTPTVYLEYSSDGVRIKNSSGKYLCYPVYGSKTFCLDDLEYGNDVFLYKCPLTDDEESARSTFISSLLEGTDVCDAAGSQFNISSATWSGLKASFNALSNAIQASLVNLTYDSSDITPRTIEAAISRYDYIYQKYHAVQEYSYIEDFIGRASAGTMHEYLSSANIVIVNSLSNNMSAIIITVVALTSISSIGVLLVVKKRRAIR